MMVQGEVSLSTKGRCVDVWRARPLHVQGYVMPVQVKEGEEHVKEGEEHVKESEKHVKEGEVQVKRVEGVLVQVKEGGAQDKEFKVCEKTRDHVSGTGVTIGSSQGLGLDQVNEVQMSGFIGDDPLDLVVGLNEELGCAM